jgi:hypothetical protein
MLLIIQIAAGIVLGFAIIAYRTVLLKSVKWLAAIIVALILIAAVFWIGSEAVGAAEPYLGKFYSKIAMILGVIVLFVFGILGGLSLLELCREMGWLKSKPPLLEGLSGEEESEDDLENVEIAASVINVFLVSLVAWLLLSFTPIGDWNEAFDQWSRNNGFADGGPLIVFAICLLWPVLPLWFLTRRKGSNFQSNEIENSLGDDGY